MHCIFVHVSNWLDCTPTSWKWNIKSQGPLSIKSFKNNNFMLFLVDFSPLKLVCGHSYSLKKRMLPQKCATLISYAIKRQNLFLTFEFDYCNWYFSLSVCVIIVFFPVGFLILSGFSLFFFHVWPPNSWITNFTTCDCFQTNVFHTYVSGIHPSGETWNASTKSSF